MTDVVVIRPDTDAVEHTLSLWLDLLLPPGVGLPNVNVVLDLKGAANATPAAAQAGCGGGDVLLYFGHGDETSLGDPQLLDTATIAGANGRTVIAIACLSSHTLGPNAVSQRCVAAYLGFSEPLFVYNLVPGVIGSEVASCLADYLIGNGTLAQAEQHLESSLQAVEQLFHTGAHSNHHDAPLIWMGARMNWRGLELS